MQRIHESVFLPVSEAIDGALFIRTLRIPQEITPMSSPSDNEYLAAVAGLHEQTISRRTYAVGDYVSGRSGGRHWSGHIVAIEGDRIDIEAAGAWITTTTKDITH